MKKFIRLVIAGLAGSALGGIAYAVTSKKPEEVTEDAVEEESAEEPEKATEVVEAEIVQQPTPQEKAAAAQEAAIDLINKTAE